MSSEFLIDPNCSAYSNLKKEIESLGVSSGDVLYLSVDLSGIKYPNWPIPVNKDEVMLFRERSCRYLYDILRDIVGLEGTILAPAFTYSYARLGSPFLYETSKSEVGPFTEWFRTKKQVVRSLHPLFSICGEGPKASSILLNCGKSAFGPASPFGRFCEYDVKLVSIGTKLETGLTFVHHLEQIFGVNYAYNKLFNTSVYVDGIPIEGPWLAFLRYLDANVDYAIKNLTDELRSKHLISATKTEGLLEMVKANSVERIGLNMLTDNPFAFIENPVEIFIDAIQSDLVEQSIYKSFYKKVHLI